MSKSYLKKTRRQSNCPYDKQNKLSPVELEAPPVVDDDVLDRLEGVHDGLVDLTEQRIRDLLAHGALDVQTE